MRKRTAFSLVLSLVASMLLLAGCGSCTEGQTRTRGTGRDIVHERCYRKVGDTAPHWYGDNR